MQDENMTKVEHNLNVRRSVVAIVFPEALLAIPFSLGLSAAIEQPSIRWTLIISFGMMIGFLVHYLSFVLRVSEGVLVYRELVRGTSRIPVTDIEKAHFDYWFTYRGEFRVPKRLIIIPKRSSSVSEFAINTAAFDDRDIAQLLQLLSS